MNFKKLFILFYFCVCLILSGCSSEIAIISIPGSELKLKLIKGSTDINDTSINYDTYFMKYIDSIEWKKYPNPFCPSMVFRINMPQKDSIKIKLYDSGKNFIETIYNDELDEGNYSLAALKGNYQRARYIISVEQNKKEWFYSMSVMK